MSIFSIVDKSSGAEVYRYASTSKIVWDGFPESGFDYIQLADPDPPPPPIIIPDEWKIYVGPFYDRFGAYKIPILASADPIVQAIIKDCSIRKYIDLYNRKADITAALSMIQAKGYPIDISAILNTKPTEAEVYRG